MNDIYPGSALDMHRVATMFVMSLFVGVVGCATGEPADIEGGVGRTSDGALMKLRSEPEGPVWRDWQPAPEASVVPEDLERSARAFDYWRVDDDQLIEQVWGAVFPVVDSVRSAIGDGERRETLDLMLEAIEPGTREQPTGMDLTFLVSKDGGAAYEGVACRLFRRLDVGATPVLTVLMLRRSDQAPTPTRIIVWAAPGFREPPPMTASYRRDGEGRQRWRRRVIGGLAFTAEAAEGGADDEAAPLAAELLTREIWERFAGRAYLQSDQSEEVAQGDRTAGPEAALGLEVTRRAVEQVYSDTEFPPRVEFDDLR